MITETDRIIDRIIRQIMLENINGEIEDITMSRMSQGQRDEAATLIDNINVALRSKIRGRREAIAHHVARGGVAKMPFSAGENFKSITGILTNALLDVLGRIGRQINKAINYVDDPAKYRAMRTEEASTAAIWSLYNIIVKQNLLNADPTILNTKGFETFIRPKVVDLVNDCAKRAIDGVDFGKQDRNDIKGIFRPGPARPGHNRHVDRAGFMVRG